MNIMKKISYLLLVMTVIYSCEDDKEEDISHIAQIINTISKIKQQVHESWQGLEKTSEACQSLEQAEQKLEEAIQALEGNDFERCAYRIKLAIGQIKDAVRETGEQTGETLDKILTQLEDLRKSIGASEEEGLIISTQSEGEKIFRTVEFYAPLCSRNIHDIFAQLIWHYIDTFTKFDFASGKTVPADSDEWDIALAGHYIIVNGGQKYNDVCYGDSWKYKDQWVGAHELPPLTQEECIVDKIQPERTGNAAACAAGDYSFDQVKDAEKTVEKLPRNKRWRQDSAKELALGSSRWEFTHSSYEYLTPKNVLLFKTRDGKYAKMQFISGYAPGSPLDVTDPRTIYMYYTFKYVYNSSGSSDLDISSMEQPETIQYELIMNPL